jgi:hypothetical protein
MSPPPKQETKVVTPSPTPSPVKPVAVTPPVKSNAPPVTNNTKHEPAKAETLKPAEVKPSVISAPTTPAPNLSDRERDLLKQYSTLKVTYSVTYK